MPRFSLPESPTFRAVATFALAGLAALAVFLAGSLLVLRDLGRNEALRDARQFAVLSGQGIVEPELRDAIADADARAVASLDVLVQERVLGERTVRVKLWTRDGRIVYSDEPQLVGVRHPLEPDKVEVLETGEPRTELSDLSAPENRFERGFGALYEVYVPLRTPNGTPLLFETYQRESEVASTGRRIWLPFAALLLGTLLLLWLAQVPLAWRLAERLRRSQREREELLVNAVRASEDERRRIASDLHDGVVQDLAGIAYSLGAAADRAGAEASPPLRETLREAAAGTRNSIRRLRSLLVEIHPPNLRATGLEAAITDLLGPLRARGIETSLAVDGELALSHETEQLVYRAAGEAVRNAERHARASHVAVRLAAEDGRVRLVVEDDGVGSTAEERERRRAEGHVGLSLLEDLASRMGGTLAVHSQQRQGTRVELEVPA